MVLKPTRPTMRQIHLGRVLQGLGYEQVIPNQRQKSDVVRFLEKVEITPNACWSWMGGIGANGYGQYRHKDTRHAHRMSYMLFVGPIPPDKNIDHLCRNRSCVNPDHLEAVEPGENVRRAKPWVRCDELHPNDPTRLGKRSDGRDFCLECGRVRESARRARFAEAEGHPRNAKNRPSTVE